MKDGQFLEEEIELLKLRNQVEESILKGDKGKVLFSGKKSISDKSQNLFGIKK